MDDRLKLFDKVVSKNDNSREEKNVMKNKAFVQRAINHTLKKNVIGNLTVPIKMAGDIASNLSGVKVMPDHFQLFNMSGTLHEIAQENEYTKKLEEIRAGRFTERARVFKVVVVGDQGVGKTTFAQSFIDSNSPVTLIRDALIVMFDLTSRSSFKNLEFWKTGSVDFCKKCPIILCGNKADVKDRKVRSTEISKKNLPYCEISAKSLYNFEKPFLIILQTIYNNFEINFVQNPALPPPENMMNPDIIARYKQELESASVAPLPDD